MLSVRELCLERHFQPVFQPLSFELTAGELLVVTGPNGSGKTTLIRLLARLLDPTEGTITSTADRFQYVGHSAAVKAELSVYENLQFCARLAIEGENVESAIATMGLSDCAEQTGRTLSAGQRKRTALARLMVNKADLWLLDEPYTNLDADGVGLIDRLLDRHLASGGACVIATHGTHRPVPIGSDSNWRTSEIVLEALERAA
jgi:heme exporter protein A